MILHGSPFILPSGAEENNRGVQLLFCGRYVEAEAAFRQALLLQPDLPPEVYYNLAKALQGQGRLGEAENLYLRVLNNKPEWALCHLGLAYLYFCQRRLSDAEVSYREALRIQPDYVEAMNGLAANVLNYQGRIDEARAMYRQALALQPDHASCHSNLLLNEQYADGVRLADIKEAHAEWEQRHAALLRSTWRPHNIDRNPNRPLRLGFVSGDFHYHPVGLFLAPVLERLDRAQWFTLCYANQTKVDDMTHRLASAAGLWREVAGLNDEALAEQIRADRVDLLIDLAGHTGQNRLLVFARRPSPVQVTWLGYVGTTGLSAMDYLIADRFHVPMGYEKYYQEQVLRLPDGYLCYEPPSYAPPVGPLPALAAGHITFGNFNSTAKVSPTAVTAWAEILHLIPDARLVLKYHWLDDSGLRRRLTDLFAAEGVAERLELIGGTTHIEQLKYYNRIDLALDPFSYAGGLTTCEASWMGVPVITCPGKTFASRHSFSHLSNIGLTETIASNRDDYIAKAVSMASDLDCLAELRAQLRQRMAGSPLCDIDRFTVHFTAGLRQAWCEYCALF